MDLRWRLHLPSVYASIKRLTQDAPGVDVDFVCQPSLHQQLPRHVRERAKRARAQMGAAHPHVAAQAKVSHLGHRALQVYHDISCQDEYLQEQHDALSLLRQSDNIALSLYACMKHMQTVLPSILPVDSGQSYRSPAAR